MASCRLCGSGEEAETDKGSLVRYGVRHSAHAACGLAKWGSGFFGRLSLWPLEQFPALFAHRAGLLEALKHEIEQRRAVQSAGGRSHGK